MKTWIIVIIVLVISMVVGEILARYFRRGKGDQKLKEKTGMNVEDLFKWANKEADRRVEEFKKKREKKRVTENG